MIENNNIRHHGFFKTVAQVKSCRKFPSGSNVNIESYSRDISSEGGRSIGTVPSSMKEIWERNHISFVPIQLLFQVVGWYLQG